jgi:hypothetical protein
LLNVWRTYMFCRSVSVLCACGFLIDLGAEVAHF